MFDQILQMVKDHLQSNPQIANTIPAEHADAVHEEVASQITNGLKTQATSQGGIGGLLSSLQGGLTSGSPVTGAIEGGVVSSLASKFGLSPAITGAIAGALPGLLQKFAHKVNDPNDSSLTPESVGRDLLAGKSSGGLGGILGNL